MKYSLSVNYITKSGTSGSKIVAFRETNWFMARIKAVTLLRAFHEENWGLIYLYFDRNIAAEMGRSFQHLHLLLTAEYDEAKFEEEIYSNDKSFEEIIQNLVSELHIYKIFAGDNFLTESIERSNGESSTVLKGSSKLLRYMFS